MKKLFILMITVLTLIGTSCSDSSSGSAVQTTNDQVSGLDSQQYVQDKPTITEPTTESDPTKNDLTFGDTFTFDNLEITFSSDVEWLKVDNEYSDHYEADVAKLPVTIKNIKDETHGLNTFYYTQYGPDGLTLDSIGFNYDDGVDTAGTMRSNATQNTYMYILYNGDGDYYVEFDDWTTKIEVKLPLQKK